VSAVAKLAAFAGVLAVLFGGAALAGAAIGPDPETDAAADGHGEPGRAETHGEGETAAGGEAHAGAEAHGGGADPVRGLAVADDGLRVVVDDPELHRARAQTLRFRIVDERGVTVRDFDVEHEKRMHLIIARRDLTGFQHLHPKQAADGSWTIDVKLEEAGSYRLFADFANGDEPYTLAGDLRVDGRADLRPLPAPSPTSVSDGGYDVRLSAGDARPGPHARPLRRRSIGFVPRAPRDGRAPYLQYS